MRVDTLAAVSELLSTDDGKPTSAEQTTGALLALASLGHQETAVALLDEAWRSGRIQTGPAFVIVKKAFETGDVDLQRYCSTVIKSNAPLLASTHDESILLPDWTLTWPDVLVAVDPAARENLLLGLMAMYAHLGRTGMKKRSTDTIVVARLYRAYRLDEVQGVRVVAARLLGVLLATLSDGHTLQRTDGDTDRWVGRADVLREVDKALSNLPADAEVDGMVDEIVTYVDRHYQGETDKMGSHRQVNKLLDHIANTIGIPDNWVGYPGGWHDEIEVALLDAVFSTNARPGKPAVNGRAATGVRKVIDNWRALRGDGPLDSLADLVATAEDVGVDKLLPDQLDNRQTVPGGSLSMAAAVTEAARKLLSVGVDHATDLVDPDKRAAAADAYSSVPGLGWVTFDYLLSLLGHPTVKADSMIEAFVAEAVGSSTNPEQVRDLLRAAAKRLGVEDPRVLDHAAWEYQSTKSA